MATTRRIRSPLPYPALAALHQSTIGIEDEIASLPDLAQRPSALPAGAGGAVTGGRRTVAKPANISCKKNCSLPRRCSSTQLYAS